MTTYTYDGVYNMTAKVVDGNGAAGDANEAFHYDGLGRLRKAAKDVNSARISETVFAYNAIGKITDGNEKYFGNSATFKTMDYTYDQMGYPTSVTYPNTNTINITPDALIQLKVCGTLFKHLPIIYVPQISFLASNASIYSRLSHFTADCTTFFHQFRS